MNSIVLDRVIPEVFASEPPAGSEVWLKDVRFEKGETVLVEARSGAGKTSLASFIMGLRSDYRGRILFDGEDARSFSVDGRAELRRLHLAYLPQNLDLFPELTAADNISVKRVLTEGDKGPDGYRPVPVDDFARRLGILPYLDRMAGKLSVGQMQRVAILRALAQPFDFIILDEPVSHLDAANNRAAAELVAETARRLGAGVIVLSVGNRLELEYDRVLRL
ncbi:MAG: ATP-binding cassette domain-containing protein [Bacteroides sp.]|nr:ATP-binding cassette domain-containing protein [Bacteroides sp.]